MHFSLPGLLSLLPYYACHVRFYDIFVLTLAEIDVDSIMEFRLDEIGMTIIMYPILLYRALILNIWLTNGWHYIHMSARFLHKLS